MATDWLSTNAQRGYPLVAPATADELSVARMLCDAGFVLGAESAFDPTTDKVEVDECTSTPTVTTVTVKPTNAALDGYYWEFELPHSLPFGSTVYSELTNGSTTHPELGFGFLTVGHVEELTLAGLGLEVEPSCVQSQANTLVEQLQLANEARPCPPAPGETPTYEDCVSLPGGNFTGDIELLPGFNCELELDVVAGALIIGARQRAGQGMQCEDLRTDGNGDIVVDDCQTCDELVLAVNGHGFDVEALHLVGGPGVVVKPDPETDHTILVKIEEEGICDVEI